MVGISPSFFYVVDKIGWYINWISLFVDNTGCYINRFCLSWTILVGKSPCFVCCEQYWLLYIPGLCAMNKTGCYITRFLSVIDNNGWYFSKFFLLWTKLAGISTGFVCRRQKLVGISTFFVGRGQYWVVYFTDVSCLDNIGW